MSTRNIPQLVMLSILGLSLGWLTPLTSDAFAESGGLLAFEDFEDDELDPRIRLEGQPPPKITQDRPLVGARSALIPCLKNNGDEPIIIFEPLTGHSLDEDEVAWLGFQAILDLSKPCVEEGLVYSPLVLTSEDDDRAYVYLRSQRGELEISTSVITDSGLAVTSPWSRLEESERAEGLTLELLWSAAQDPGSQDGSLTVHLHRADGSKLLSIHLAGIDNDSHLVGQVLFGAIGLPDGHSEPGSLLFDDLAFFDP